MCLDFQISEAARTLSWLRDPATDISGTVWLTQRGSLRNKRISRRDYSCWLCCHDPVWQLNYLQFDTNGLHLSLKYATYKRGRHRTDTGSRLWVRHVICSWKRFCTASRARTWTRACTDSSWRRSAAACCAGRSCHGRRSHSRGSDSESTRNRLFSCPLHLLKENRRICFPS